MDGTLGGTFVTLHGLAGEKASGSSYCFGSPVGDDFEGVADGSDDC